MKEFYNLKHKFNKLEEENDRLKMQAIDKRQEYERKTRELKKMLKMQQDEVVKPLIQEVRINSELLDRCKKRNE